MYQTMVYDNITMYSAVDDTTMSTTPSNSAGGGGASKTVMNVIVITMYSIIFLLAVIGNSLVIVTLIQNKRMRSVTNVFLFSLSVSDLMFICVCLPFTLVGNLIHNFIFGPVMCKLISYTMSKLNILNQCSERNVILRNSYMPLYTHLCNGCCLFIH